MSINQICTNNTDSPFEKPRPVADWENEEVNGCAKVYQAGWEDYKSKVEKLRAKQKLYKESLPTNYEDAANQIKKMLDDDYSSTATAVYGLGTNVDLLFAYSVAISEMAQHSHSIDDYYERKAIKILSYESINILGNLSDRVSDISSILHNPAEHKHKKSEA
ncbi:hypothetical protein F9L33_14640 [Amylibacter sp. SFDW26]|uniref:hypothetical protein n=1 Tax=Amylibacter sp. SFDW26 TaxID=2652722 RepID=UPI001261DD01|nr:hypothetical protein [Amylibacter sp. SFDW26]KAB7610130.1 hypothetical protein F9L33_14640 [Amylibacter sp. SFDW26]